MNPLVLTTGEPAGIGPDLAIQIAQSDRDYPIVAIADKALLKDRAKALGLSINLIDWSSSTAPSTDAKALTVFHIETPRVVNAGELNPENSSYVIAQLEQAHTWVSKGVASAIVTAPVHKGVINDSGTHFSGHTEFFADKAGVEKVVMMLAAGDFRVTLATTHLPLKEVSGAITKSSLSSVIRIINRALQAQFGIEQPNIVVCGLNPHAGEDGHLGMEEIEIIAPTLDILRQEGIKLEGPLPADTAFTPRVLQRADTILAMYHDQGLPTLKYAGFGNAVNITLGLGYIRTSVDHGTALDLAGTGRADSGSLLAAIESAAKLVRSSRKN